MSRYYGFTIADIKKMTMYQYTQYMQNIHKYEMIANGENTDDTVGEEADTHDIARRHGINIPD